MTIFYFFRFGVNEILCFLEDNYDIDDDELPTDIVIFPPENKDNCLTDEDSGDEDDVEFTQLAPSHLRNNGELKHPDREETEWLDSDNIPLAFLFKRLYQQKCTSHKTPKYTWNKTDLPTSTTEEFQYQTVHNNLTPLELFTIFFDKELMQIVFEHTNKYAAATKNNDYSPILLEEIEAFIGILILSGYNIVPQRYLYWDQQDDTRNDMISKAMTRQRFSYIMSKIHVCDNNNLNLNDKFAKVRLFFNHLANKFLEYAPVEEAYSVDEVMVPYFGRRGSKQFIRGKPIRWGYSLWVGATKNGYIVWFDPYQGAEQLDNYCHMNLGTKVVLKFSDELLKRNLNISYSLFFDNFFSSFELFSELKKRNIYGTGTFRENRLYNFPLLGDKSFQKKQRGFYDYMFCVEENMLVCRWNDNSMVTIGSNKIPIKPLKMVKRYSQKENKQILIEQPNVIHEYNQHMGGVNRSDQNISLYRTSIRGKKWYFPLIVHGIDMAIANAWQLHRQSGGKFNQLNFRRMIAIGILKKGQKSRAAKRKASVFEEVEARYDRYDHWIETQETRLRCRLCHKQASRKCTKCNVTLHLECFKQWHTK